MICAGRRHSAVFLCLLRSTALLLGRRFQTEEERAGPADTGDLSRYLRKRAESFTVEVKAVVQHGHTMSDSVPFPNQDGSRLQSSPPLGRAPIITRAQSRSS